MKPQSEPAAIPACAPTSDFAALARPAGAPADRAATPGPGTTPLPAAAPPRGPATVDYQPAPGLLAADEVSRAETTGGAADSAASPAADPEATRYSADRPTTGGAADSAPSPGPSAPAPTSLATERYEILGELGRGGCGVVYRARERRSGRVVALKTMRRADGMSLEFFKREFRYLQGVSHPNLAQLYDLESDGQEWLLTMELLEGVDFLTHVRPDAGTPAPDCAVPTAAESDAAPAPGGLPPLQVDRLREALGQLAEGIMALHAHRRIHRDLKPGNVRVTPRGSSRRARLRPGDRARCDGQAPAHRQRHAGDLPLHGARAAPIAPRLFTGERLVQRRCDAVRGP